MSRDAIVLLKDDHKTMRKLFRAFRSAEDPEQKGKIVDQIIAELTAHTYIENEVMYPRVRELVPDLEQDILESYEEHHVADLLCLELLPMNTSDEHYSAKATVLIENVEHHIQEEEDDWFPKVRESLGRKQLQDIGEQLLEAKQKAPRKPTQPSALRKAADALLG